MMIKTFKTSYSALQLNCHNNLKTENIRIHVVYVYYSVHKNNAVTEEAIVMAMSRLDEENEGAMWKTTN